MDSKDLKFRQVYTCGWEMAHELIVTTPDGAEVRSGPTGTDQIAIVFDDQIDGLPMTDQSPRSGFAMTTGFYQGSLPMLMRFEAHEVPVECVDATDRYGEPKIEIIPAEHIVTNGPPYEPSNQVQWVDDEDGETVEDPSVPA